MEKERAFFGDILTVGSPMHTFMLNFMGSYDELFCAIY